jgi:hypothetical protein
MARPIVFYHDTYDVYYIFRRGETLELYTELIEKIKNSTAFLEATSRGYVIHDERSVYCDSCTVSQFYRWYQQEPCLRIVTRGKAIPRNMVIPLIPVQAQPQPQARSQPRPVRPRPSHIQAPKPHLVQLVLCDAIAQNKVCAITLEPITMESTCIVPCYHCFDTDAIYQWLTTNTSCPECRESCV